MMSTKALASALDRMDVTDVFAALAIMDNERFGLLYKRVKREYARRQRRSYDIYADGIPDSDE